MEWSCPGTMILFSKLGTLIQRLAAQCMCITIVVPNAKLYWKWDGVPDYVNACTDVREFIRSRGINCTDASDIVNTVRTFDGEHFDYSAEATLVAAVARWIVNAPPPIPPGEGRWY